ncbi:FKBP-type peptidyl-prolyl cis-trans isomerase [Nesidiocoris tenuis]|uniref:peptidylprolyl isomerase n=1 Tax=Nesidiocoris tenuis TaxID=355587 RepID=A0ABN7AAY3_9HEMI|nr:FKBP-type peptidyl-prolyl cis-trans isomerase [Nesidiocoris tenuis]
MNPDDVSELKTRLKQRQVGELLGDREFEFTVDAMGDDESTENSYDYEEYQDLVNRDCVAVSPDHLHNAGLPFTELAEKMTDVTPDGKLKKLILAVGTDTIQEKSLVNVHYNFFLENSKMPFDSTYLRLGKPARIVLGNSGTVVGFDIAAMTMKVGERAQFLVHYDLAFKEMGSPPRIPQCATILMDIHILKAVNCGDALHEFDEQQPKNFNEAVKLAMQYRQNGNDTFFQGQISVALRNYLQAEKVLLRCFSCNEDSEERDQACREMLLLLYTNMAICYNHPKKNDPRLVIKCFDKALNMDETGALKNAKLLYNRGVAFATLFEYDNALKDLTAAWNLEPNNPKINKKIEEVNNNKKKNLEDEKNFVTRAFGMANISNNATENLELSRDFKEEMRQVFEDFSRGDRHSLVFPPNYTNDERLFFRSECSRLGLIYEERMMARKLQSILFKKH